MGWKRQIKMSFYVCISSVTENVSYAQGKYVTM